MLEILNNIIGNYVVRVSAVAWITAQVIKIILYYFINKKFTIERLFGAGGMPSSHSALVSSVCVAVYKVCGVDSVEFALALVLAGIVMYDAMGVRRAAGEQAKVINQVVIGPINQGSEKLEGDRFEDIAIKTLKELLGHTPLEVLGGAILGVAIGIWM